MKFFLVVWTAWACPGGGWFAAAWPAKLRPLACAPVASKELYDPARAAAARRRVRELGEGAALYTCYGVVCGAPVSSWSTDVTFKEASPP